ncbi:hypothetical protein QWJ34_00650 [Saccharibacillus sp. CPCC 101409]|uniref:hypothetical protein n=1 Tax=Saccharibacillus sp. CPCC 101409 TaxID=3058041 RepID=UPI002671436A|nr:hypothetical protein [Saccharibacillus sp. CPCC 101409]MDO3408267.1 hypothetical protein [Saccharibacillus sp. CPCC 101409]
MLYLTDNQYGADFELFLTEKISEDIAEKVVDATVDLRAKWIIDANSPKSMAMEKAVSKMLDIPYYHYDAKIQEISELNQNEIAAVKVIYDVTQKLLCEKNVDSLIVYRGLSWEQRPDWWEHVEVGGVSPIIKHRTLSSWTLHKKRADIFVDYSENNYGIVLKAA